MNTLTCIIIGQNSLAQRCGEILLSSGYQLCGIISKNESVQAWTKNHEIAQWSSIDAWAQQNKSIDYIFSIVNDVILSENHLRLAHKGVINYHDSLLPSYAGVHATSWAIASRAIKHGISWHLVDSGIDTGDILIQKTVFITPDETALSLNLKCHQAGVDSFKTLIKQLAAGKYVAKPQNLSQRRYYPYHKKPPGGGIIDWQQSADEIESLFRALSFGYEPNRLATVKLFTPAHSYQVQALVRASSSVKASVGQIIVLDETQLRIATTSDDIIIQKLFTLDGEPITLKQFGKQTQLHTGDILESIDKESLAKFTQICEALSPFEPYWVDALIHTQALPLPYLEEMNGKGFNCYQNTYQLPALKSLPHGYSAEVYFVTLWLIYLYRLNNYQSGSIGFADCRLAQGLQSFSPYFTSSNPLTITFTPDITFAQAYQLIEKVLIESKKNKTYLRDIFARYPQLAQRSDLKQLPSQLLIGPLEGKINIEAPCVIYFDSENHRYRLYLRHCSEQQDHIEQAAEQIHGHLKALFQSSLIRPASTLVELNLLTDRERQQLLAQASTYEEDEPYLHKSIPELFAEQVKRNPNSRAILFHGESLTYQELDQRSNQLAHLLQQDDVKVGDRIAIYMRRCPEAIIAMLGILKVGAIYVPIDPDYPIVRFQYIIKDAAIHFVLVNEDILEQAFTYSSALEEVKVIEVDYQEGNYGAQKKVNCKHLRPSSIAYVMYTSGSTGYPKGVLISYQSITRLVKTKKNIVTISPQDRMAHHSSLSFDATTFEVWGALLNGALLHIIDKEVVLDINKFITAVQTECSILFLTTALFNQVIYLAPQTFDSIRLIIFGGELAQREIINQLLQRRFEKQTSFTLVHAYGPTENTTFSTYYALVNPFIPYRSMPIGKPIAHTQVYILDQFQRLLPSGIPGELYVGGLGLAKGYLNQPQLTHQQFITHPFSVNSLAKVYKTKDIVRWLPDKNLEFLGRLDRQVKVRGMRVELGEIEENLLDYPGIKQVVVLLESKKSGSKRITAYMIVDPNIRVGRNGLQKHLSQRLPKHMLPVDYQIIDKLPLTVNGKIDKDKLSRLSNVQISDYHVPQGVVEKQLEKIWCHTFKYKRIGRNENYFALGGDSIIAMEIASLARQAGLYLKPSDLLTYATIARVAQKIELLKQQHSIQKEIINGNIPFTPIQHWFFQAQHSAPQAFSQYCVLKVHQPINKNYLEKSFEAVIKHHDILRACFNYRRDKWRQTIVSQCEPIYINKVVMLGNEPSDFEVWITDQIVQYQKDFDLSKPPLVKVFLFHHLDSQVYLLIIIHHLIIDAVSWRVLLNDLLLCYQALAQGDQPQLPTKTHSYRTWSEQLAQAAKDNTFIQQQSYWQAQQTHRFTLPPADDGWKGSKKGAPNRSIVVLGQGLTHQLLHLPPKHQLRAQDLLLTALIVTIHQWTKQYQISIDIENHGRHSIDDSLDLSRTIGWFTTIYPFTLTLPKNIIGNLKAITRCVKSHLRQVPNQGLGYGILRYLSGKHTHLNKDTHVHNTVCFNYLGQFITDNSLQAQVLSVVGQPVRFSNGSDNAPCYPLEVMAWMSKGQLTVDWQSNDCYSLKTIQSLANHYIEVLTEMIQACHKDNYPWVTPEDFPGTQLSLRQCSQLVQHFPNTQHILRLLPLQQGLLFHSVSEQKTDAYIVQVKWQDNSGLELDRFKQAWNALLERHMVLRARFIWDNVSRPVQLIAQSLECPWQVSDWEDLSAEQQQEKLVDWLKSDRKNGFDLAQAPLMRLHVIRLGSGQYIIVWTHHHILLDGWSLNLILSELYSIYNQLSDSQSYHLATSPAYNDYVQWYIARAKQSTKTFWVKHLDGLAKMSLNPVKTPQHPHLMTASSYGVEKRSLDRAFSQQLKSDAKKMHLPMSAFILTTWLGLLSRYTQCQDTITGMTLAVRGEGFKGLNKLVAPAINTVPFRYQFKTDETVSQCLHHIRQLLSQVIDHGFTSLANIQSWASSNQKLGLFETLIVIENYPLEINKQYIQSLDIDDRTHYPITLVVCVNDQLTFKIYYDQSCFSAQYIKQLLKHLTVLLEQIQLQPEAQITQLSMIPKQEYQQSLKRLPQQAYRVNTTLVERFAHLAKKFSSRIAVTDGKKQLTYVELDLRSNQLAHYLIELGINPGMFVALCLQRNVDVIISILAVLKTGAAYIPIDPDYPPHRIHYIAQDSQASVVISQTSVLKKIGDGFSHMNQQINLENQWSIISKQSTSAVNTQINTDNLAYIIYTSGSTGTPKGVVISHKNVLRLFLATENLFHFNHQDVWILFHSYAFDFSVWEMWGALLYGGKVVIVPYGLSRDPQQLHHLLLEHQVSVLNQTPSAFKMYLKANQSDDDYFPSSMRWVIFGGEKLDSALLEPFMRNQLQNRPNFVNMYGITETTVHATYYQLDLKNRASTSQSIIGKPLADLQIYLLDAHLQPVPQGTIGEMWIIGDGVSQGYWNKPELTTTRFIKHPLHDQKMCFRTGDLARYLADGNLEYISRSDSQVKIRGFRIELSEISFNINQYSQVTHSVVHLIEADDKEKILSVYLQVQDKPSFDINQLKHFLKQRLPSFMIPHRYMLLDEVPQTINGKIDQTALAKLENSSWLTQHKKYQQAQSPEQKILVDMWQQLLNIAQVGTTDDFFEIGGNSILVLELIARINTCFAIKLNLSVLFTHPTIKSLARQIITLKKGKIKPAQKIPSPIIALQPEGSKTPIFLVHPVGGTIFWFKSLVQYFSKDRPVYGIQDPGLEAGDVLFTSFEEMARFYREEIRRIQPHGPYILGGASLGANIAVEIGKQFEQNQQKISCILSLDGWAKVPKMINTRDFMQEQMWRQYHEFKQKLVEIDSDITKPRIDIHWHRSKLLFDYQLKPFDFKFIQFKAEITLAPLQPVESSHNHWDTYAKRIQLIPVPGNHTSMFYQPHVPILANKIENALIGLDLE